VSNDVLDRRRRKLTQKFVGLAWRGWVYGQLGSFAHFFVFHDSPFRIDGDLVCAARLRRTAHKKMGLPSPQTPLPQKGKMSGFSSRLTAELGTPTYGLSRE
jgi:hypothetical protein